MNTATTWFAHYGYLAVFFPVMLELVGIPFPSETILLAAGATASLSRKLNLEAVIGLGLAAAVLGALLGYGIGRVGGRRVLTWVVQKRLLKEHHLTRVDGFFHSHGGKTLVVARFLPGIRIPTFWMAGAGSMPVPRFMAWNVTGAAVWVVSMTLLGYAFAGSVGTLDQIIGRDAAYALGGLAVLAAVGYMVRKRLRADAA